MVSQGAAARRSAIGPLVMVGLGALALLSPAIANGYPFLYFDTETYHQVGRDAAREIGLLVGGQAIPAGGYIDYTGGRSPYYSLFVYMGATAAGIWVIAAVQALITAWLLYVIALCVAPVRPLRAFALVVAGLALASTLPFYAAFAMPDIMTGWAILAPAALALWLDRLSLPERIGLVVVAAFGLTTHATNPVLASLALVILAVAVFVLRLNVDAARKRGAWAVAPVVTAMAMSAGYTAARAALFDVEVRNPPYLMARVLADGPAHDYLQKVCAAGAGLEICRYKDKALVYHGDILWSANPEAGVFQLADDEGKRRLVDQEFEFVVGAVVAHPLRQAVRSAKNSLAQLVTFAPSRDFSPARRVWTQMQFAAEIPGETAAATAALAYREAFPFKVFDGLNLAGIIASLGFLAWRLTRADALAAYRPRDNENERDLALFAAAFVGVIVLLIANSVICGTLSGVHERYQGRIIWLLPLIALLVLARFGVTARPHSESP